MLAKYGISGKFKEFDNNDKSIIHLPRQVSYTINWTRLSWGKEGHNVPQTSINTTGSATKV